MLKIGITGGIGSGKSTVAHCFALLGVPVYNADEASKRLYHTNAELQERLKAAFGETIYTEGQLNRQALAAIVFNDPEKLTLLNSLVHPPTIKDAEEWMAAQTAPYLLKEAALLFESGSVSSLDYVIGVSAPESLRLQRVMARDGVAEADVRARMARQMDETEKMARCQFIIYNNEEELVLPQVLALHERLLQLSEAVAENSQGTQR
jgi:dephospho-CoA kinase